MNEKLVSELVAICRRDAEPAAALAARLARVGRAPSATSVAEVVRRARREAATDEELGLALGVLLALSIEGGDGGDDARVAPERSGACADSGKT